MFWKYTGIQSNDEISMISLGFLRTGSHFNILHSGQAWTDVSYIFDNVCGVYNLKSQQGMYKMH